jgi:hypothetical protein
MNHFLLQHHQPTTAPRATDTIRRRESLDRLLLSMSALIASVATAAGWTGVGDAPNPHRPATEISQHFLSSRDRVLNSAGFGYVGALAFVGFVYLFARRLHRSGAVTSARFLIVGGVTTASYLVLLQVLWTTLSYDVAANSPEASKAVFDVTILAAPVLGIGVTMTLLGAAIGASRARLMPRWWTFPSAAIGVLTALAMVAFADSGFASPDVQQQLIGNALIAWLIMTAAVVATRRRKPRIPRLFPPPRKPSVVRPVAPSLGQVGDSQVKGPQSTVTIQLNRAAS